MSQWCSVVLIPLKDMTETSKEQDLFSMPLGRAKEFVILTHYSRNLSQHLRAPAPSHFPVPVGRQKSVVLGKLNINQSIGFRSPTAGWCGNFDNSHCWK